MVKMEKLLCYIFEVGEERGTLVEIGWKRMFFQQDMCKMKSVEEEKMLKVPSLIEENLIPPDS